MWVTRCWLFLSSCSPSPLLPLLIERIIICLVFLPTEPPSNHVLLGGWVFTPLSMFCLFFRLFRSLTASLFLRSYSRGGCLKRSLHICTKKGVTLCSGNGGGGTREKKDSHGSHTTGARAPRGRNLPPRWHPWQPAIGCAVDVPAHLHPHPPHHTTCTQRAFIWGDTFLLSCTICFSLFTFQKVVCFVSCVL